MSTKRKVRRGYATVEAIDPSDGKTWDVLISHTKMDTIAQRGMGHAKELAHIVPKILRQPTAIFKGVREEEEAEWLCYVGIPSVAYHPTGESREPWPGEVFLVFVNSERIAYTWRWEKADPRDRRLPVDYENRFDTRAL